MKISVVSLFILISLLFACTNVPVKPESPFQLAERHYLYNKNNWFFSGRLALSDVDRSLSASINWKHQENQDEIELAGPFGQGRTFVVLTHEHVSIDYGDKLFQYNGDVDDLVSKRLKIAVPISALKYWLLGLTKPKTTYVKHQQGFLQLGWTVEYQQMQRIKEDLLPRKITMEKGKAKLKLVINHWNL